MRSFALILFLNAVAYGQTAAISPAKKAAIEELANLMGLTTAIRTGMEVQAQAMRGAMMPLVQQAIPKDGLSPEELSKVTAAVEGMMDRAFARLPAELSAAMPESKVVELVFVPSYDKHFSEEEIKAMTAFYGSPTGRKMVETMPLLMRDVVKATQDKFAPAAEAVAKRIIDEEVAKTFADLKIPKP